MPRNYCIYNCCARRYLLLDWWCFATPADRRPRMAIISRALRRIKQDLCAILPDKAIEQACQKANHRWRRRRLGPVETIHLFILQVLHFNTAMTALRHVSKVAALKAPAYCKARMRLPLAVLESLLEQSATTLRKAVDS